tara:strand:- start:518 stop:709 length:192 start_codon:yes stop_codon:yes gene_type:complete
MSGVHRKGIASVQEATMIDAVEVVDGKTAVALVVGMVVGIVQVLGEVQDRSRSDMAKNSRTWV